MRFLAIFFLRECFYEDREIKEHFSSLAALENVIETMKTSLGPLVEHYDPTVVDEPRIRRRRKDLHSIHLYRIQLFAKFATREQSLTKNLIQVFSIHDKRGCLEYKIIE